MSKLSKEMTSLARKAGGAFKTVSARVDIAERVSGYLQNKLNIQIQTVAQIQSTHVEAYIQLRLAEGVSKRTLQNESAALRMVLSEAGRDRLADSERLSNKALGLAGASRQGTKEAIPDDKFHDALRRALERDKGLAVCLMLGRELGLRAEEMVQANKSLMTWLKGLEAGATRLTVIFGTKTGRPRETTIIDRESTLFAVRFAIEVATERGGVLIDKPGLKEAMDRFTNEAGAIGLTGKHSPHSLRYAYAQDAMGHHERLGFSVVETLALTSTDLGHGDGRGRYVRHVYCKKPAKDK